jgi:hypothetical protein
MKGDIMKTISYIVVRIKDKIRVIFEDEFIDKNEFRTQNEIIEVLKLLYEEKDFSVDLFTKEFKK